VAAGATRPVGPVLFESHLLVDQSAVHFQTLFSRSADPGFDKLGIQRPTLQPAHHLVTPLQSPGAIHGVGYFADNSLTGRTSMLPTRAGGIFAAT
jgi:hypothetical protein